MLETFGIIVFRTVLLYGMILLIFRIMGKREIGELSIIDLVVFVMLAEIAVTSIEKHKDPLYFSIVPMIVLLIIQTLTSFISLKNRKFRRLMDGEPTIIIKNGNILEEEMRKQRYTFDDLLMQLRQKDIRDINEVEFAILETTGKLSVFKKGNEPSGFTVPLILDGNVEFEKLKEINKSEEWLMNELKKNGISDVREISFCSYNQGKLYIDRFDEKRN